MARPPSTSNVAEEEGIAAEGCGGAYVRSFCAHREGSAAIFQTSVYYVYWIRDWFRFIVMKRRS